MGPALVWALVFVSAIVAGRPTPIPAPESLVAAPQASSPPIVIPVPAAPAPGGRLPAGVPEPPAGTDQLVTVLAPRAGSGTASLRAWQRDPAGGWKQAQGPVRVGVGTGGVGRASERSNRTPAGTFSLVQAFGRAPNPGTRLPYRRVGDRDWWVSDSRSAAYNTYRSCAPGTCPFDESAGENLGQAGPSYDHAIVIGYNTDEPVPGAGSAFFLHVDAGVPSAGCVVAPRAAVVALLRWLDPAARPRVTIAVG
jgi:L,D-peptidoglycan transpeptidase YkuD (ErfK/YbiS/YcfS/YnhG family)